jgi:hypothetical protein
LAGDGIQYKSLPLLATIAGSALEPTILAVSWQRKKFGKNMDSM